VLSDVKNNFESSAIEEDNWIHQMAANGKRVVMMGDDTWAKLFPGPGPASAGSASATPNASVSGGFARAYPFPSFNVKDLHTVDNGCIQHLLPTLRGEEVAATQPEPLEASVEQLLAAAATSKPKPNPSPSPASTTNTNTNANGNAPTTHGGEWEVVIAHFLGVDHVGHKFSAANVQPMQAKLEQIDGVIASVIEFIDTEWNAVERRKTDAAAAAQSESVVLFVVGDHGMTGDGNHGGQTAQETDTTLFVYSSKPLFQPIDLPPPPPASSASAASDSSAPNRHHSIPGREWLGASECARVPQIDFVPTLCLLLGVPIPYANLGMCCAALWATRYVVGQCAFRADLLTSF
jgi:phosphatidylinositol glycan class O